MPPATAAAPAAAAGQPPRSEQTASERLSSDEEEILQLENHPSAASAQPVFIACEIKALERSMPILPAEFEILTRLGEGTFSTVYKARYRNRPSKLVALKTIYVVSGPSRLNNEVTFLKQVGGVHNVVKMLDGIRYNDRVVLVLDYFENDDIKTILRVANDDHVRFYMRALFEALAYIHHCGIIHRDLKPTNFLYNLRTRRGLLVDFGLAEYAPTSPPPPPAAPAPAPLATVSENARIWNLPTVDTGGQKFVRPDRLSQAARAANAIGTARATPASTSSNKPPQVLVEDPRPKPRASRAGTRGFRAPEILFKHPYQTTAVDVWSAGIIMLSLMTGRYPFFIASDDMSALYEIRCIFGREAMQAAGLQLERRMYEVDAGTVPESFLTKSGGVDWRLLVETVNPEARGRYSDYAYDLLNQCLQLDPGRRITALAAQRHPYLAPKIVPRDQTVTVTVPRDL